MKLARLGIVRLSKGLTQRELADLIRTDQGQISRWERGWSASRSTVLRLTQALGCKEKELV